MRFEVHLVNTSFGHTSSRPLSDPSVETLVEAIAIAKKHYEVRKAIASEYLENDTVSFEIVVLPF